MNTDFQLLAALLRQWEEIKDSQITTEGSYWHGAFAGNTPSAPYEGIIQIDAYLSVTVPLYAHPSSALYRSGELLTCMQRQMDFLLRSQRPSGCVSLNNCNMDSPPDTGFAVHLLALGYHILNRLEDEACRPVLKKMELFLTRAMPGLLNGGIHTPNHRWVLCGALALCYELFGDERLRQRADRFLAEGLDINADGEWTERSNAIYNAVCTIFLYHTARVFGYGQLYEPVSRNLRMMQYMLHPRGEIATEYSSRQDRGVVKRLDGRYYVAFQLMAAHDQDPLLYRLGQEALAGLTLAGEALLYRMFLPQPMQVQLPSQPLPVQYERLLNEGKQAPVTGTQPYKLTAFHAGSPLLRYRQGELSVTVMTGQPDFLYLQYGQARLLGLRLSLGWFGVAGVPFAGMARTGEHEYELTMELEGSYRDAVEKDELPRFDPLQFAAAVYERKETNVSRVQVALRLRLAEDGLTLRALIDGDVPPLFAQLVFSFDPEGSLSGDGLAPIGEHAVWFKRGALVYRNGEDEIEVAGGDFEHGFAALRNDRLDPQYLSAVSNYVAPMDREVRIRCRSSKRVAPDSGRELERIPYPPIDQRKERAPMGAETTRELLQRVAHYTMHPEPEDRHHMRIWQWGQGVALYGLGKAYDAAGNPAYLDEMETWLDHFLRGPEIGRSINTTAPLLAAVKLLRERGAVKYEPVCRAFADWCLHEAPRSTGGAFEHSCTENHYPSELWADTLFMGCLFLAEWGDYSGEAAYKEEAARQFVLHYRYLHDPGSGLIYHGYHGGTGRQMGVLWGRGNGWLAAAAVDVLDLLRDTAEYAPVLQVLQQHLAGVVRVQAGDGGWHTVLDDPSTYEETTATVAFAYSLNKAYHRGYVEGELYAQAALRANGVLLKQIDARGRLTGGSGGTCVMETAEEYNAIGCAYSPFTQGLGLLALAGALLYEGEGDPG